MRSPPSILMVQLLSHLAPVLAVTAVLALFVFDTARTSLETEVGRKLQDIARIASGTVPFERLDLIEPGSEQTRMVRRLHAKLDGVRQSAGVAAIEICTARGTTLLDPSGRHRSGDRRAVQLPQGARLVAATWRINNRFTVGGYGELLRIGFFDSHGTEDREPDRIDVRWLTTVFVKARLTDSGLAARVRYLNRHNDSTAPDEAFVNHIVEPPEVDPDGTVTLQALEHDVEMGRAITYTWRICLFSLGDFVNFECIDPRLELPLDSTTDTAEIDFGPGGLNLRALYNTFGPVRNLQGDELTLEDGFEVYVHLVTQAEDGRRNSVYKRVRIRDGDMLNRNPTLEGVTADGAPLERSLEPGETVELEAVLDESTRDTFDGVTEVYNYQWFTESGVVEDPFGPTGPVVDYTAPKDANTDTVIVLVRDGRGGTVLQRLNITIDPPQAQGE
jgi:hypothetical protein